MRDDQRKSLYEAVKNFKTNPNRNGDTPSSLLLTWLREMAEEQDIQTFAEGCSLMHRECASNWMFISDRLSAILVNNYFPKVLPGKGYSNLMKNYHLSEWARQIKDNATKPSELIKIVDAIIEMYKV